MRNLILVIFFLSILTGCQQKRYGAFTVSGKIENATIQRIALQEIPFSGEEPIILDSTTLTNTGTFELKAMAKEEGLYRLVLESGKEILLVNDGNSIRVKLDLNNYRSYSVEGSEASEQLHTLMENLFRKDSTFYSLKTQMDTSAAGTLSDSLVTVLNLRREQALKDRRGLLTTFIRQSKSPAAICYALGQFDGFMPVSELKQVTDDAANRFPEHSGLARFKSLLVQKSQPEKPAYALIGQPAPEIRFPTPTGDTVSLSSLKGKYVLVDFWASWCAPCRRENPNIVMAYNKFRDKNFTVLGVSLDDDKQNWEQAIKDDNLTWQHISDLKNWNSVVVAQYHFDGIPFNVLVDPSGKIIASELRGEELQRKLSEVLK